MGVPTFSCKGQRLSGRLHNMPALDRHESLVNHYLDDAQVKIVLSLFYVLY